MTGQEAYAQAKRLGSYGSYDQVVWKDKLGNYHTERVSYASIKQAMLAVGTQGKFTVYHGNTPHLIRWCIASAYLKNLKLGYYRHSRQ